MRCLIIGAAGFIGRRLGKTLKDRGHEVVGLDLPEFDITREEPVIPAGTDAVWYLAQSPAYRTFPRGAGDLFAVNVAGALRAAEAAAESGATAFAYASTGTVYTPGFEPMDETRSVCRDQAYSQSKLAAEEALALFDEHNDALSIVCPRLFGVFGPGQRGMMVPAIIDRVRDGRAVTIERNPHQMEDEDGLRISLTYVDDVVEGMIAIAKSTLDGAAFPRIINVAAAHAISVRQLATTIGQVVGREPAFEVLDKMRASDYIADTSCLSALIPWTDTPLDEAVRRTVEADAHD
jgi:nucleoside-diphosphate-sugar epimerase